MKNQIEEQVLKEFKDEWLKKECMKDLKKIIKLTQQKTAQAIFSNILVNGCLDCDDYQERLKRFKELKKEWVMKLESIENLNIKEMIA